MHEGFVLEQLVAVVVAEGRARAQADAGGAGGGLGDQLRIQHDVDHAPVEEVVEVGLQLQLQCGGRDRHLFRGRQQFAIELVGDRDEVPRRLARGRAVARQRRIGTPEQRIEQSVTWACRSPRAVRRAIDHDCADSHDVAAERMLDVGLRGNLGQFPAGVAEIVRGVLEHRQRRLAARPLREEGVLDLDRPADQVQQLDATHGAHHARVERGVVDDVGNVDVTPTHVAHCARPALAVGLARPFLVRLLCQAASRVCRRRRRLRRAA